MIQKIESENNRKQKRPSDLIQMVSSVISFCLYCSGNCQSAESRIRTPFTGSLVDGKCCCRNSNFSGTGSKSTGSFIISVVFTFCPCASVKGDSQIRKYWIKRIGNDYGCGFICRNVSFILNQERVGQASVFSNRYRTDRFCDT